MGSFSTKRLIVAAILSLLVAGAFVFRIVEAERSTSKMIGIYLGSDVEGPFVVEQLLSDGPAEKAGMARGDRIVEAGGVPIRRITDFDLVSAEFESGVPVEYVVERDGKRISLHLLPGVPLTWWYFPLDAFVLLCALALAVITWSRRRDDLRSRLLALMFSLIAISMVLPYETLGSVALQLTTWTSYYLLDALEVAVVLHLVMLIPKRPDWLVQRPWLVPLVYTTTLVVGFAAAAHLVLGSFMEIGANFWALRHAQETLFFLGGPVWGVALIALLICAIRRTEEHRERLQAQLVLVGLVPLIVFVVGIWTMHVLDLQMPQKADQITALFLLPFLVAVAIAMFRYDLIDMELVIERGVLYSLLTTVLFLLFYAFLGIGGAVAMQLFGEGHSIWVASTAALMLGLLINPLRKSLHAHIERRIFPERSQQRQRLAALAAQLPASGSVSAMADRLVKSLREILGVANATLYLVDHDSGRVEWEASDPEYFEAIDAAGQYHLDNEFMTAFAGHRALRRSAVPRELSGLTPLMDGSRAELLLPLEIDGRMIGILALGPAESHRAEDEHTLELFCRNVAMVFENVRLFQSATYDGLTGLPRREVVLDRLEDEVKRSVRHHRPLSLIMLDLDEFKNVNDRHGHLTGDAVLRAVADTIRGRLRSTDTVGRFGGEEFIAILPETAVEQALELAEDLRLAVERIDFCTERGERIQTRISAGVSTITSHPTPSTAAELIAAADSALYRAKRNGRNRTEMALVM
jgi:diguanylate cyclase (GGDEF)-like protein